MKRSYFFEKLELSDDPKVRQIANMSHWPLLQSGATCYRGAFQTIRPSPHGLYLNLDIAHAVFYSRTSLLGILRGILGGGLARGWRCRSVSMRSGGGCRPWVGAALAYLVDLVVVRVVEVGSRRWGVGRTGRGRNRPLLHLLQDKVVVGRDLLEGGAGGSHRRRRSRILRRTQV